MRLLLKERREITVLATLQEIRSINNQEVLLLVPEKSILRLLLPRDLLLLTGITIVIQHHLDKCLHLLWALLAELFRLPHQLPEVAVVVEEEDNNLNLSSKRPCHTHMVFFKFRYHFCNTPQHKKELLFIQNHKQHAFFKIINRFVS